MIDFFVHVSPSVFLWTGVFVWFIIGFLLLWLIGELMWAGVVTFSVIRFMSTVQKVHGSEQPKPCQFCRRVGFFFRNWIDFLGFRNGNGTEIRNEYGAWSGVGLWYVHPNHNQIVANVTAAFAEQKPQERSNEKDE